MSTPYALWAKRTSPGFISVKDTESNEIFVNTGMIVNVVEINKGGNCILNMYGGAMSQEDRFFCKPLQVSTTLNEIHERIDNIGADNFTRIKGIQAIFNTDYSFRFSQENSAIPIGMRIDVPGTEIYGQVDLASLPPLKERGEKYHQLSDNEKGTYWVHVNLILGLLSEGNSNYWHVCLVGGRSVRVRGPLRKIFDSHPNLKNIPLVNVKDGTLLNLNHIRYFHSGKNKIRLCDKLAIENSNPHFECQEFFVEKSDDKTAIKNFLHTGEIPIIHFRQKK